MPYSCLTAVLPPFHGFSTLNLMNLGRFSAATGSLVAFFCGFVNNSRRFESQFETLLGIAWHFVGSLTKRCLKEVEWLPPCYRPCRVA